jgi:hypothetical protein
MILARLIFKFTIRLIEPILSSINLMVNFKLSYVEMYKYQYIYIYIRIWTFFSCLLQVGFSPTTQILIIQLITLTLVLVRRASSII